MSLKIKSKKELAKKIVYTILGIVLLGTVLRIAIWEKFYYTEKEGSERSVVEVENIDVEPDEEINEEEVTEDQKAAYTVAPDMPRYIIIDSIGVKARVLNIGKKANGQMSTPVSIYDAGWYNESAKPGLVDEVGQNIGTAVFDGHNGASKAGVFKKLPEVKVGQIVKIEMGNGKILEYTVKDNERVGLNKANKYMKKAFQSPEEGKASITIISCSGEWNQQKRTYSSRQFLRATLND